MVNEVLIESIKRRKEEFNIKPKKQPTPKFPKGIERQYARNIKRYLNAFFAEIRTTLVPRLPQLLAEANSVKPDSLDDNYLKLDAWPEEVEALINAATISFQTKFKNPKELIDKTAVEISDFDRKQMSNAVKAVVGVDVFLREPYLNDALASFSQQNVKVITNIIDNEKTQIQTIVQKGIQQGSTAKTMGAEITKRTGIADRRANLIARDQVGSLNSQLGRLRAKEIGVKKAYWITAGDERVRKSHEVKEEKIYDIDKGFDGIFPGSEINCFPGDLKFKTFDVVNKLFRHFYTGHLTELVTNEGFSLKATPNHPVLTNRGWLAINLVQVGDYIFNAFDERVQTAEIDDNILKPSFSDCFDALAIIFGSVKTSLEHTDFHGDAIADEKVDVINIDSFLSYEFDAILSKHFLDFLLTWANQDGIDDSFSILSGLQSAFYINLSSSKSVISSLSQLFAFIFSSESHSIIHSFRSISGSDAILDKPFMYDVAGNLVSFSQFFNTETLTIEHKQFFCRQIYEIVTRLSGVSSSVNSVTSEVITERSRTNVKLGGDFVDCKPLVIKGFCVTNKFFREFVGHVYNLETKNGYYGIQSKGASLVVHNCRCVARPIIEEVLSKF